ncbi:MAG: SLBB domain-containing protein, partial [Chitinophagaceae bacterium]
YGNNISSQKLVVSPEGKVNVKYAGLLSVSGLSIEQAAAIIRTRLLQYYPGLSSGGTKIALTLGSVRSINVMVVGAVKKPGTITLPSVATLFNALYASGGPLDNGSFRNIQLVRNNQVVANADLYDFIMKGNQQSNLPLRDNDVILVPFAEKQIVLSGALNREGVFEIRKNESFAQALQFAGGFQSQAFRGRVTGTRVTDVEKQIIDVAAPAFDAFTLEHGDSLHVSQVVDRYQNRVSISGAVFKPGAYALEPNMDIRALIAKGEGLKEDAFKGRVNMVRMKEDRTREYLSFSLEEVYSGKQNISLRKEDSLHVTSLLTLRDSTTVSVFGAVRKPGTFRFEDSLSLQALILQAGGFAEDAFPDRIEIGRRNLNAKPMEAGSKTSEIIEFKLDKNLGFSGGDILLQPYDFVSVKSDPARVNQIRVTLTGEILYAGSYTLSNPKERLSSVLKRAGGLLPFADLNGARLIRQNLKKDTSDAKRLLQTLKTGSQRDSLSVVEEKNLESNNKDVALNLRSALEKPGGQGDLVLQDGDEVIIPRKSNTVSVSGEVLNPINVQYSGSGLAKYISAAGGYSPKASKNRLFVIYPNGIAAKTRSFLGLRNNPKILP